MNAPIGTDVQHAARLIAAGRLVAFPTETVYGLGANALDTSAVAGVFAAKERPHFDPLIVHVATLEAARDLVTDFPDIAVRLAERFWPGPLTLVLPKVDRVPDLVTAGLPSVAVRIPAHPLALELIERAGVPIAAPSANPFGQVSPTTAQHVAAQLADRIDYILDGGPCRVGVESTVLHLGGERPLLLRPGGVSLEDLEAVIGPVETLPSSPASDEGPQAAPGLLERHYAPRTPLQIVDELPPPDQRSESGLLTLGPVDEAHTFAAVEVLSPTANLTEAAAHFYAALRRLDDAGLSQILARRFPPHGLGRALNDRLQRAAK
jgi:L-threonylcarbamoyladenylate synthase